MFSTAYPEDTAILPPDDSSEKNAFQATKCLYCEVCRELALPYTSRSVTTYAKLQRAAADGCELCELLRRLSEWACTDAGRSTPADDETIHVWPGNRGDHEHAVLLKVCRPLADSGFYKTEGTF